MNFDILIAEDENIIAKDLEQVLKKLGHNVLGISRTADGIIELAREKRPQVILMDIMLFGEKTGIEAAAVIQNEIDIPVIFLTALTDSDTLEEAKKTDPFGYIVKPFDQRSLHTTLEMAIYKHQISSELRARTAELEIEKKRSQLLLNNILPTSIIEELKDSNSIIPKHHSMVSLLFTDFQGFTAMSAQMPAQKLVEELNDIFKYFDEIVEKYNLEKLKTIGDSYMAGGGLPHEYPEHAANTVAAALEMQNYISRRNKQRLFKWQMRAGIHSGPVIAGVIGKKKFTYDVWGETVNIASRMERYSLPGKVNITKPTYDLVKDYYNCVFHGSVEVMVGRTMDMYFVEEHL